MRLSRTALALLLSAAMTLPSAALASHNGNHTSNDAIRENTTSMKNGIVEALATWIPFVILFVLIGVAMSALGINLFRRHG